MAYVIDVFDKFNKEDRDATVLRFNINEVEYAIKKIKNKWNIPRSIEDNTDLSLYQIYDSYEEALAFVKQMKSFNQR